MEASAAEAEAISAALAASAAAKAAREQNGEIDQQSLDRVAETTPNGKPPQSSSAALMALNRASMANTTTHTPPTGVRLHHRAVSSMNCVKPVFSMTLQQCYWS